LDKGAAGRIIKHGLAGNDRYDEERAARQAREKAGAQAKLEELNRKIEQEKKELAEREAKHAKKGKKGGKQKKQKGFQPDESSGESSSHSPSSNDDSEEEEKEDDDVDGKMDVDQEDETSAKPQISKKEARKLAAKEAKSARKAAKAKRKADAEMETELDATSKEVDNPTKKRKTRSQKSFEKLGKKSDKEGMLGSRPRHPQIYTFADPLPEQVLPQKQEKAKATQASSSRKKKSDKAPMGSHEAFEALLKGPISKKKK
jgi:exosome complex protein LRP1